jgi:hypothetical protein
MAPQARHSGEKSVNDGGLSGAPAAGITGRAVAEPKDPIGGRTGEQK